MPSGDGKVSQMNQENGHLARIAISEARSALSRLVASDQPTILLRNNRPVGAVLSIAKFNEYETLRAAFASPLVLKALIDTAERTRHLPLSELRSEQDLRDFLAARSAETPLPPAGSEGAVSAPRAQRDSRRRGSRRC